MEKFYISIIIPIYNVAEYLDTTVNSSLNQTYKDIEIILVDDGSTDCSGLLCDEFKKKDDRIKVIHKENGGLSSARNAGVGRANGNYVLFLDGDDYLRNDAVERLVEVLKDYPSDIIQFEYIEVDNHERAILQELDNDAVGDVFQAFTPKEFFCYLYQKGGVYASGCTKLFKKELIQSIPFRNIRHEDEMWCTEAFQHEMTVTYISDVLYYYVMRENSIIHSQFNRNKLDSFKISSSRISVLNKLGLDELVEIEYNKLFQMILSLYHSAKSAGDKGSLSMIHNEFIKNKQAIAKYGMLKGKFRVLFDLMRLYYPSINLYDWYWNKNGLIYKEISDEYK